METIETETFTIPAEQTQDANKTESAENFQKFIYELFDKNGILNDLRAYLRGHIVNVLKNAHTGDPPSCQKHFTQRLDPKFQALNMLVTEYLICMEFSYSLSVFISEIPLANMVFGFAKSLMELKENDKAAHLRFKEHDVWAIMNYLGIKCDSEHANNIIEMYKTQKIIPLLLCILKCMQLHDAEVIYPGESANGSVSSDSKLSDSEACQRPRGGHDKCNHYAYCKTCRARFQRLKDNYKKKKRHFCKNVKQPSVNPKNVQNLLKKIEIMERNLVDEMFEQQKSVYETEVDMVKSETEDQIKRSLASHALHFQQRQSELEETFKAREASLEGNIEHKKRFLWGLAKALRSQHAQMTNAMQAVKEETKRLADKEQSLKSQLKEAEECLRQRGEDMRKQIADELAILEQHLESMRSERNTLNRERFELDTRKSHFDTKIVNVNVENTDLCSHYELLKEELAILKRYLDSCNMSKCVAEQSTITDVSNVNSRINVVMNNETEIGFLREEVKPNQVVNDLKKQKNVNFSQCQSNVEDSAARSSSRSRSPSPATATNAALRSLVADNERLRRTAAQQSAQIAELETRAARLHAALRPRTAPAALPPSARTTPNSFGWCKGAGEELSLLSQQPTVLVPGAPQPFIGVCGERRTDSRRHLINQWRSMRHRMSPLASGSKTRPERNRPHSKERPAGNVGVSISSPPSTHREMVNRPTEEIVVFQAARDNLPHKNSTEGHRTREKSPKSVLREAKEKLRTVTRPSATRPKSPCAALREAKLRLRKLEIEAAAVERSYIDFRRRRERRKPVADDHSSNVTNAVNTDPFHTEDRDENSRPQTLERNNSMRLDIDNFLSKYQNDLDIGKTHFRNKNTAAEIRKPIPNVFSEVNKDMHTKFDYLAKPLPEFRKLYYTQPDRKPDNLEKAPKSNFQEGTPDNSQYNGEFTGRLETKNAKNKERELKLFEQNLNKIYNLQDEPTKETADNPPTNTTEEVHDNNLLRVEIETAENENDVLLIESSVDSRIMSKSESYKERLSTQMTIVVSPKHIDGPSDEHEKSRRSLSPEQEANLTRKDVFNAIFDGAKDSSSNEIRVEPGDQDSGNEQYADDFSADVDNYNSKSGTEDDINSPVSIPKTSEDDFWD